MMVQAILDPSMIFIREADWMNEERRDGYLENLSEHLDALRSFRDARVLWTEALESSLWEAPTLPPWRQDRDWNLQMVPIIHRSLSSLTEYVELDIPPIPASTDPVLLAPAGKEGTLMEVLSIAGKKVDSNEPWYFAISPANHHVKAGLKIETANKVKHDASLVCLPSDWISVNNAVDLLWPELGERNASDKLVHVINAYRRKRFADLECTASQKNFCLSRDFVCDLVRARDQGEAIVFALGKRMALGQALASSDEGIQDEPVRGKKEERRFRVNGECRVHYKYQNGSILFLRYYGEGEHDDGLR